MSAIVLLAQLVGFQLPAEPTSAAPSDAAPSGATSAAPTNDDHGWGNGKQKVGVDVQLSDRPPRRHEVRSVEDSQAVVQRLLAAADHLAVRLGNLRIRPELRFDCCPDARPYNDQNDKFQLTGAIDVLYEF